MIGIHCIPISLANFKKGELMQVLSLFDGISCGLVALNRAGINVKTYYASEIDRFAISISEKNHKNIQRLGDINNIDFTQFIGKIDLLIGGSPCQDLSSSNAKRAGLQGTKSILFYKFLEALTIIKPKYFLLENVASMSSVNRENISKLLGVKPIMINSCLLSAQNRKRLYWCNWTNEQPEDKSILLENITESTVDFKYYKSNIIDSYALRNIRTLKDKAIYVSTSGVGFGSDGVTKLAEAIDDNDIRQKANGYRVYLVEDNFINARDDYGNLIKSYKVNLPNGNCVLRRLTPLEWERLQTLPDNYTEGVSDTQRYKMLGNGWTVDVITHLLKGIPVRC